MNEKSTITAPIRKQGLVLRLTEKSYSLSSQSSLESYGVKKPCLRIAAKRYGQANRTAHYRINRKYFDIFGIVSVFGNMLILTDKYGETNRSNNPEIS